MKISIARSDLLDALTVVSKGMSARSTLPILSGVYMEAVGGNLVLQSTDLEVSVRHSTPALVEQEGTTVVPGKLLSDIVRALPEAAVTLEIDKDVVSVRCQHAAFTVKTLNPADFPRFPELSVEKSVSLPAGVLSSMVRKVAKAVSRDETRAVLTGVLFVIEGPTIRLVATDSYRLAMVDKLLDEPVGEDIEAVVPGRALDEATKLAAGTDSVRMGVSQNQVVFEFGETTFVTRRVEGSFPNYRALIPKETETTIEVVTEEMTAAAKRVSLLAMHNTPLRIAVLADDQTVSLSATTQDVGDASEDLMVKVDGRDVEIAFNHAFLMDGLASIPTDTFSMEIQSALKPGLLKSSGDEEFLYLLMPVRLG